MPLVFIVGFNSDTETEKYEDLCNHKQCVSVGLVLSVALVTNDFKINLRAVGVASGKMH